MLFAGEKINLAVTVLLGFLFVQEIIADLIPKSENVPYLAVYVVFALLVSTFNVAACACIVAVYNLPQEQIPPFFVRLICARLGRMFDGIIGFLCLLGNLFCAPHHTLRKIYSKLSVGNSITSSNNQSQSKSPAQERTSLVFCNKQLVTETVLGPADDRNENDFGDVEGHFEDKAYGFRNSAEPYVGLISDAPLAQYDHDDLLGSASPTPISSHKRNARDRKKVSCAGGSGAKALMSILDMSSFDGVPVGADGIIRGDAAVQTLPGEQKQIAKSSTTASNNEGTERKEGSNKDNWQEVARVMNVLNSIAYAIATAYIFYTYFVPILPLSKTNFDINGKCPH